MSVHAGTILTVAGRTVLQRVQSAGLGNVNIPKDTIREVGNELVVDKVPTEPDFTFTIESLAVDCDIEAMLHGKRASGGGSNGASSGDADGTEYPWETCESINILSPWKDHKTGSAGHVEAGHLVPGYYPTRIRYEVTTTGNFTTTVDIAGGSFFYGKFAPVEDAFSGDGVVAAFATTRSAVELRRGGAAGTTFKMVFGVLVNGVPMVEGDDYDVTGGGNATANAPATVTFRAGHIPANGARVRVAYFTTASEDYPQSVHRTAIVLPGAVRGRHVCVSIAPAGSSTFHKLGKVQSFNLEGTYDTAVERELCNEEPTGRTVNGVDCNGAVTVRSRDASDFFNFLEDITGIDTDEELVGYINQNPVQLKIEVLNPRNLGETLKTLYVKDALFDIPGTPARVNTPTDFAMNWSAQDGTYSAFKGEM